MKKLILTVMLAVALPLSAATASKLEISSGASMQLYQSVFSFQPSFGGMAAIRGKLHGDLDWQLGVRLGSQPGGMEGFGRLLAAPEFGAWAPMVGFEIGLTQRARFEAGDKLLREARQAMEGGISPFYVGGYAAPLSFKLGNAWRLSVMELQIVSHLGHLGRTMRLQVGAVTLGLSF